MTRYEKHLQRIEAVLAQRDYTSLYACSSTRQLVDITAQQRAHWQVIAADLRRRLKAEETSR
jgi:hypothetical protein